MTSRVAHLYHDVSDVEDGAHDGVDTAGDDDESLGGVDERLAGDLYRRAGRLQCTPAPPTHVAHTRTLLGTAPTSVSPPAGSGRPTGVFKYAKIRALLITTSAQPHSQHMN